MKCGCAALFVLLPAALAVAQPAQPEVVPLTLDDAVARAVEASARLREAAARTDAAGAGADLRRAASMPLLALQAGYTRTNHVDAFVVPTPGSTQPRTLYPDIPDNYRSRLDLQWPLFNAGRFAALERAARNDAAAAAADAEAARADVALEAARAYWTLVTAIDAIRVVEQSITSVRAHLAETRQRLEAGVAAPHEVLAIEAQEARQRLLAIQAQGQREVAEADLARLVGLPRARLAPVSPLGRPADVKAAADALVAQAAERRSERDALSRRIAAAEEREGAARLDSRPTIGAVAGFDYARPNPRIFPREGAWRTSWDASVNVGWSLFDGGRNRAAVAEAAAAARAVRARRDEFDAVLEVEVRRSLADLTANLAAIDAAEQGVRAAAEARRVAAARFTAGVATSAEVLDAQVAELQAELDRTQAVAGARVAAARLDRAIGR